MGFELGWLMYIFLVIVLLGVVTSQGRDILKLKAERVKNISEQERLAIQEPNQTVLGLCFCAMIVLTIIKVATVVNAPLADVSPASLPATTSTHSDYDSCVRKGIAYFSDLGWYPILPEPRAGQRAIDLITQRCNVTTTAYP